MICRFILVIKLKWHVFYRTRICLIIDNSLTLVLPCTKQLLEEASRQLDILISMCLQPFYKFANHLERLFVSLKLVEFLDFLLDLRLIFLPLAHFLTSLLTDGCSYLRTAWDDKHLHYYFLKKIFQFLSVLKVKCLLICIAKNCLFMDNHQFP